MKNWFVLQTKPLKEQIVAELLGKAGLDIYYPRIRDDDGRPHSFFPCYEFVLFNYPSEYNLVRYTRGVRRVVGNEHGPIPLEAAVIDEIRAREKDGFIILEDDLGPPEPGDLIEVVKGPLRGLKGIFSRTASGEQRVAILLNYVNFQGSAVVPRNYIRRARP